MTKRVGRADGRWCGRVGHLETRLPVGIAPGDSFERVVILSNVLEARRAGVRPMVCPVELVKCASVSAQSARGAMVRGTREGGGGERAGSRGRREEGARVQQAAVQLDSSRRAYLAVRAGKRERPFGIHVTPRQVRANSEGLAASQPHPGRSHQPVAVVAGGREAVGRSRGVRDGRTGAAKGEIPREPLPIATESGRAQESEGVHEQRQVPAERVEVVGGLTWATDARGMLHRPTQQVRAQRE